MKILAGALIGGLIVGIVAFMLLGRGTNTSTPPDGAQFTPEQLQAAASVMKAAKPRQATITLRKSDSARCLAEIDSGDMGGHPGENVKWTIADDEDNPCRPDGAWSVWLVFEGSLLPFPDREVRIGRASRVVRIKGDAVIQPGYVYKVWMRGHNNAEYELIDPVLEVEDPPRVIRFR